MIRLEEYILGFPYIGIRFPISIMCRTLYLSSNESMFSPFHLHFDESDLALFDKSYPSESTPPEHSGSSSATLPDGRNPFDARMTTSNIPDGLYARSFMGHPAALGYESTGGTSTELLTLFDDFLMHPEDVCGNASLNYQSVNNALHKPEIPPFRSSRDSSNGKNLAEVNVARGRDHQFAPDITATSAGPVASMQSPESTLCAASANGE